MNLINRRDFLAGFSGLAMCSVYAFLPSKLHSNVKQKTECDTMRLRPHHILDIISAHGQGIIFKPNPYGHSLHIVAPKVLSNPEMKAKLVLAADDICSGCIHLKSDGLCDDVLAQLHPAPSKQAYNDVLDCRLFDYLSIEVDSVMTIRAYLEIVKKKTPGIEKICTHPKENQDERLAGLITGLCKMSI